MMDGINIEVVSRDEVPPNTRVFSFTTATDLQRCPTYGVVRRIYRKKTSDFPRQPLTAGKALHLYCAAFNLFPKLASFPVEEIDAKLGDRWPEFVPFNPPSGPEEFFAARTRFAEEVVVAAGYENPFDDKKRTLSNILASGFAWAMNTQHYETVRVEEPFILKFTFDAGSTIYYGGVIDLIRLTSAGHLQFVDYKSGAIRDDASTFSHQFTGYWIYLQFLAKKMGVEVADSHRLQKIAIPPAKATFDGVSSNVIVRCDNDIFDFVTWLRQAREMYNHYSGLPTQMIPQFRHSCYRYFSLCELLDICSISDHDDRQREIDNLAADDDPNPLDKVTDLDR